MQIYLIRHTPPAVAAGTCYGQSDLLPDHSYPSEFAKLLEHLQASKPQHIYSSPLQRCRLLAQDLAAHFQLPAPDLHPELMEMNFGAWEMQAWQDIELESLTRWSQNLLSFAPPGGECLSAMALRVRGLYRRLLEQGSSGNPLVVTHAGVMRIIIADILGVELQNIFDPHYKIALGYSSVLQLQLGAQGVSDMRLDGRCLL